MRILTYLFIGIIIISTSCSSTKTSLFGGKNKKKESNVQGTPNNKTLMPATPIREVEEKLVSNEEKAPGPEKYFVIIGSFKELTNAREHQAIVRKDGFSSEVLKNEAGLYRVSVMATNDITAARNEVRKTWAKFPEYSDTWMLISKGR